MLIEFTERGLYCAQGDFYIDPWLPVDYAIITHAHSDHAKPGCRKYLCHTLTKPLLELRLGNNNYQTVAWNEPIVINGTTISLHPAGHIIGSSQVRVEYKGEIWVASGDYKTEDDHLSGAFEPLPCHTFITESTFGLPIYDWKQQEVTYKNITDWIVENQSKKQASVLFAYSLGKSQRLLKPLSEIGTPIYVHGAVWNVHQALIMAGIPLPHVERITAETPLEKLKNAIILAPSSADNSPWMRKFTPYATGVCSGWMQVRGNIRRHNVDRGFPLSDHADWKGLLSAIKATGAAKVYVTHGFKSILSRYLNEHGIAAEEVKTEFGDEKEEIIQQEEAITKETSK